MVVNGASVLQIELHTHLSSATPPKVTWIQWPLWGEKVSLHVHEKLKEHLVLKFHGGERGKCATQVHHWSHYSSITTLHKYTTGHTTLPSPPTQVHHWPRLLQGHHVNHNVHHFEGHSHSSMNRPTQVHYWPQLLWSITTLLQIECTTHLSSATPPPRSRESNEPFEEKRCHYMKSLRNILFSSDGCERD